MMLLACSSAPPPSTAKAPAPTTGWLYRIDVRGDHAAVELCGPDAPCVSERVSLPKHRAGMLRLDDLLRHEPPDGVPVHAEVRGPLWTPWARVGDRYVVPPSTFRTVGRVVFGDRVVVRRHEVAGAELEVLMPALRATRAPAWVLQDAMCAVATLYGGRFPRPKVQAIVLPQEGDDVGFGQAERGGGGAVTLYVGDHARYEGIKSDWTAVHEVMHLALPQTVRGNAWFNEGIASYYQYLLLARVGLLTPERAWQALHAGFGRGRSDHTGRTLDADSVGLGRFSAYWRVYWAGAAFAFRADVELRRRGKSLDEVVRFWRGCCPDETSWWDARPLLWRADEWLGEALLVPLGDAAMAASRFPGLDDLYAALGLDVSTGTLRFDDAAPDAALRRAITARSPNPCRPPAPAAPR